MCDRDRTDSDESGERQDSAITAFKKWKVEGSCVLHKCGVFKSWAVYGGKSPMRIDYCKCGIKRPPNHIRRLLKLVEFRNKLGGY